MRPLALLVVNTPIDVAKDLIRMFGEYYSTLRIINPDQVIESIRINREQQHGDQRALQACSTLLETSARYFTEMEYLSQLSYEHRGSKRILKLQPGYSPGYLKVEGDDEGPPDIIQLSLNYLENPSQMAACVFVPQIYALEPRGLEVVKHLSQESQGSHRNEATYVL